jgi:hypothetical protein
MRSQFFITYNAIFCFFILCFGLFLVYKPHLVIELQRKFYASINWKIEPISLSKELRNTRIMGLALAALSLATLLYLLTIRIIP